MESSFMVPFYIFHSSQWVNIFQRNGGSLFAFLTGRVTQTNLPQNGILLFSYLNFVLDPSILCQHILICKAKVNY